ncbi:hypothetical protein [Luteolibacter arcticus]|uniref:hypothetical protein n=1 Tax=Luteolibacter arcticus TaxID=1581411 RepID=UPI002222C8C6|nr:hypothetical protein [Luteolibacter arcticus]
MLPLTRRPPSRIRSFQRGPVPCSLATFMAATPRPWYRSPALWFALPGLIFLLWGWVFSMQRVANLNFEIGGYSGLIQNEGSAAGATWREAPRSHITPARTFDFKLLPRSPRASTEWFPLPYYLSNRTTSSSRPWHQLEIPYWLLVLVYLGVWQLPWLARYHRQRRIARSLAIVPADAMKPADGAGPD